MSHSKTLPDEGRLLDLIQDCDGIVFHRDETLSLLIDDELVAAGAIFPGSLSWLYSSCGTNVGPIQTGVAPVDRQCVTVG